MLNPHSLHKLSVRQRYFQEDFSVLSELENLELIELVGSNTLPDLSFLKSMKNLITFIFNMNVLDGDLSECLKLSYVCSLRSRRHYNIKNCNLLKSKYVRGNEDWNNKLSLCRIMESADESKVVYIKMKEAFRIILLIINMVSFVFVLLFGITGIIYELLGPAYYEKMLEELKIPWSFEYIWLFMFACLIILIISYFLRKKLFGGNTQN